jgi:hypothetical protein
VLTRDGQTLVEEARARFPILTAAPMRAGTRRA